jgi:hypothetical protein
MPLGNARRKSLLKEVAGLEVSIKGGRLDRGPAHMLMHGRVAFRHAEL